jgi:hypothetical protein
MTYNKKEGKGKKENKSRAAIKTQTRKQITDEINSLYKENESRMDNKKTY